ncbi:MAG: hypothetical protein IT236_14640, partial [Bacteroidia bacterium]|nr:hypothetical protein [Bacteroidia bacterium]
ENITYLNLSNPQYANYTRQNSEQLVNELMKDDEVCIVHNQAIVSQTIGLMLMSISDVNLFVMDSRKTACKKIELVELLKDEYQLPSLWFALNKAGYNPNVALQIYNWFKNLTSKLNKHDND